MIHRLVTGDPCPCCGMPIKTTDPKELWLLSCLAATLKETEGDDDDFPSEMSRKFELTSLAQRELLRAWAFGYRYIAADSNRSVYAFKYKPIKYTECWFLPAEHRDGDSNMVQLTTSYYSFLSFEDPEPVRIDDIFDPADDGDAEA